MANTYVKIATVTVGSGGSASMDFSSIPSTYTDLAILVSARGTANFAGGGDYYAIKVNNSSANLSQIYLQGNGGGVASGSSSSATGNYMPPSDYTTNTFSNNATYFTNYSGAANKSFYTDSVNENNATTGYQLMTAFLWAQTTAINQITLTPGGGNFAQYSTATLYGISKS
jgi:hypothetical protein